MRIKVKEENKLIIKELDEQQCIIEFGYRNILLNELIENNIMYMYDKINKCYDCGCCWMNEEEIDWYIENTRNFKSS